MAGLVDRFIERYAKAKLRSWRDYKAVLDRDVIPALGERPAGEVTRAKIADLLDKAAGRAPDDLRRTATTLLGRHGIDQMTIAQVLNHARTTKATVTGAVYDRYGYIPQNDMRSRLSTES